MQFPIIIGLHRSRILSGLFVLVSLLAAVGLAMLPRSTGNLPLFWLLWLLASLMAVFSLRPARLAIRIENTGALSARAIPDDHWETATLGETLFVHPWLTVFRLQQAGGKRQYIVLTFDSLSAEDFRRLRVFLRWQRHVNAPTDGA